MGGFDKFMGSTGVGKAERFAQLSKDMSNKEKRKLEMALLKPGGLPPDMYKKKPETSLQKRTIKLVLDDDTLPLFEKHFKVLRYIENCVTDVGLLLALLKKLESGEFYYDKNRKELIGRERRRRTDY
jgi:hypothetical protein